jgi:hypothetical protein
MTSCSGSGQQCSEAVPCCPGLECNNIGTLIPCDGTQTCVCLIRL